MGIVGGGIVGTWNFWRKSFVDVVSVVLGVLMMIDLIGFINGCVIVVSVGDFVSVVLRRLTLR